MRFGQRCAFAVLALSISLAATGCELLMSEHRSGRLLGRVALDAADPGMEIAFTHSVLGTPVLDRYVWRAGEPAWYAELIEERFEGEGYGLAATAAAGEVLARDGAGWRLQLQRKVDPLVVRPLPAQRMRLRVQGQPELLLGSLGAQSIEMQVRGCAPPPKGIP